MRGVWLLGAVLLAAAASVSAAPPLSAEGAPPPDGEESPGAFSLLAPKLPSVPPLAVTLDLRAPPRAQVATRSSTAKSLAPSRPTRC
jgi:hypothetical protein